MKAKIAFLLLIVLLIFTNTGMAAGKSGCVFYGFSGDSEYCAFETFGYYDGSGFPYSKIYIIDIDKNAYAVKPFILEDSKGTYKDVNEVRTANFNKAASYFKKYGISKKDTGNRILNNSEDKHDCSFKIGSKNYNLKLNEKNAGKSSFDENMKIFELKLVKSDKKEKVLQKDTYLPKSRGEALGYSIISAYTRGNKLVVFIEYSKTGFEGHDFVQMAVTGTLD